MSATTFTPVGPDGGPLDPTKAVRFVEGMVLGVDDFQQEHAYLAGLANEALRLGAGVGTLTGLKVTTSKVAAGAGAPERYEVHVTKGAALDAQGRLIRVPEEQCAELRAWVAAQLPSTITAKLPPPNNQLTGTVSAYVTASYAQAATDSVPVPGEPCRTDAQLMTASRWTDDFQLNLALDPPPLRLRQAMSQYFLWTRYAVALVPGPGSSPTGAARTAVLDSAATLLAECRKKAAADQFLPTALPPGLPAGVVPAQFLATDFELQLAWLDAANVALVTDVLPEWLKDLPADGGGGMPQCRSARIQEWVRRARRGCRRWR